MEDEFKNKFDSNRNSNWWNFDQCLPVGYNFGNATLNFNLPGVEPIDVGQPVRDYSTYIIPKLKSKQQLVYSNNSETFVDEVSPINTVDWMHDQNFKLLSPIKKSDIDYLPTSEDIWVSYKAAKMGAAPEWPVCCIHNMSSPSEIRESISSPVKQETAQPSHETNIDQIIACLDQDNSQSNAEVKEELEKDENGASLSCMEWESLDLSLDEERSLLDFLKSKRLHTPLSDIKTFEMLLSMARNEESRDALRDLLRPKILLQLRPGKALKAATREAQDASTELDRKGLQRGTEPVDISNMVPHVMINNEDLQKAIDSITIVDQTQEQLQQINLNRNDLIILEDRTLLDVEKPPVSQRDDQSLIVNVEKLPPLVAAPKEDAVQQWLQQLGQDLSRVVQSRLDSMPNSEHSNADPIDFEAKISECGLLQPKGKAQAPMSDLEKSLGQWENSYKRRLDDFEDIIDHNMTEFRDPQGKRLRTKWLNEPGKKNLDSLKRVLQMPALPTHLDQRLQQLRILRQPTKRKVERTNMPIEMKMVRMYSTLQANCTIDMNQLALELDNTIYNTDIQVLQRSYEAGHVAWIWENGSILISNARSKALLMDTQKSLLTKILGDAETINLAQHNALHSQVIHIAQFAWQICIEEFSQTYALSSETVQDSLRYAYYVNKSIPGVAAKVYESGAIQVFAMTAALADGMLEKLYLITANHRKPKTTIIPKPKPECHGTFIPLFPT